MDHLHQYGCDTAGLNLKLGYSGFVDSCSIATVNHINFKRNIIESLDELPLLSLSLVPAADHYTSTPLDDQAGTIKQLQQQVVVVKHRDAGGDHQNSAAGQSTVSGSFSNSTGLSHVKRERSYEDQEANYNCLTNINNNNNNKGSVIRKKLRLKKDQAQVLEERFKQQSTLNPKQKQALARQLNLSPRQVEVWYQNRRARTKLKKTELDYEYLKKCCETLTEENRRLVKELKELKALKQAQPNGTKMPAATLSICPSCEVVSTTTQTRGGRRDLSSKPKFFNTAAYIS